MKTITSKRKPATTLVATHALICIRSLKRYNGPMLVIAICCAFVLFTGCASPRSDHYAVVAQQRIDQPTGFSNNPSSAIVPALAMRYAVAFDDHTDVFDDAGRRRPGSSAMGFAYSDDSGETWRTFRISPPVSSETLTLVGSASLAVGEIPAREAGRYPDFPVYYAASAISGSGDRPNQVRIACSTNRGESFATWTSVPAGQYVTVNSPSLAVDKSNGRIHLAFVADQGTNEAAIEQWDGTYPADRTGDERAARPCELDWTLIQRISEDAANRQYVRHPIIQFAPGGAGGLYIAYELQRQVADPTEFTDRELTVRVKLRPPGTRSWFDIVPVGRCCSFLHPYRFRSHTLDVGEAPRANGMNQMNFVVVPGRNRNKGIIVWSGVTLSDTGRWPTIHYEEFIIHVEHFQHEAPPEIVFDQEAGMAFLPTAAGIGDAESQGEYGVRGVSWYFQRLSDGQISLIGRRSRSTGLTWEAPRNLTLLESPAGAMPLCPTLRGEWGQSISSLMFTDLSSRASHALVFYMSSRGGPCADNRTVDNRVRVQEIAALRWLVDAP